MVRSVCYTVNYNYEPDVKQNNKFDFNIKQLLKNVVCERKMSFVKQQFFFDVRCVSVVKERGEGMLTTLSIVEWFRIVFG